MLLKALYSALPPVLFPTMAIDKATDIIKSGDERKKAKLFLQTKAGKEMIALYEYAAEHGMDIAQKKLIELQKYM